MGIPEEILKSGRVVFYADSDNTLEQSIIEHNKRMGECRIRMKQLDEIKFAYLAVNPLVICGMIAAEAAAIFSKPAVSLAIIALNAVLFIVFALIKGNFIVSTAAVLLLHFLDIRFLILLAADIFITALYEYLRRKIKKQQGYPVFLNISIRYERGNRPNYVDDRE